MRYFTGILAIVLVCLFFSACRTPVYTEPRTVIGINELNKEKLGDWVKCQVCKGNGNCTECKGRGKKNGQPCTKCEGTGKCTSCDGQGGWRTEASRN